jgi:predicted AlkP superfamily phosphohydrolase/phosphomutase
VTPKPPRILFLGLDAADPELALRWAEQGELPALRALRERAVWGRTENPEGFYAGSVWPSFATASTPARHGQYCWKQFDAESYLDLDPPYDDGDASPWWLALDRAGREVAVVDLPRTIFRPDFGGLQVHDWGTHHALAPGFRTSPPELAAELLERFGSDPVGTCSRLPLGEPHHYRELVARLRRRIAVKRDIARELLGRWSWDVFALGFGEAHCVGHQCWHVHDERHLQHDPALRAEIGDPLLDVYRALDAALGELLAVAGPETLTLVLLSHGMGPRHDGDRLLDEALARIERRLRHGRRLSLRERLARRVRRWPERAFRKSFRIPTDEAVAGIRINLLGREPRGRIRPGEEYDAYCDALARELMELRNPDTGGPAFERVERCDALYDGPRLDRLPDLLAEWTRDHRPDGLFLAAGAGLTPSRVERAVSVMDFGPTIAARLGVELPEVDGRPIRALLAGDVDSPA